jgi:hypothetical protein
MKKIFFLAGVRSLCTKVVLLKNKFNCFILVINLFWCTVLVRHVGAFGFERVSYGVR